MGNLKKNFSGINYPADNHDILVEMFSINEKEVVLDAGGGHMPFSRADFIVEKNLLKSGHRDGKQVPSDKLGKYIAADITCLPFKDKSFDFIFCSHVLEHVDDPAAACGELMRVGKRGYIETPRKWTEFYAGHPSHRWLVDLIEGKLYFEKRRFINSPFMNFMLPQVWKNPKLYESALTNFRNITCVQLYWEERFEFAVDTKTGEEDFDYEDPDQAAYSHYCFARNVLELGAPPEYGLFHAETAVNLDSTKDEYKKLLELYYSLMKEKRAKIVGPELNSGHGSE
jgi:SAM-dependent methyltransferase